MSAGSGAARTSTNPNQQATGATFVERSRSYVDAKLEQILPPEVTSPQTLHKAMRYSLFAGGKRLRPALALAASEAVGGNFDDAAPVACAVEMIHTYSLIHDDLPAMDDDDLRRGRPTCHKVYGDAMAILAGDALLLHAFRVLLGHTPAAIGPRLLTILVDATWAMVRGQVYDTLGGFEASMPPADRVRQTHELKTGALIRASVVMGGLCAQPEPDSPDDAAVLARLDRAGACVGLAFQIVDDLLDVTQTTESAGKRTGKDAQAGKLTYPGVLGLEASREQARRLLDQAQAEISDLGAQAEGLRSVFALLHERTR
ncbi:MAG: polyprenyl synthetase family protein [Phycisphaerales bacterium]|nr:polyprenyl synthetase family protein [Phycisphaerales bacterium]